MCSLRWHDPDQVQRVFSQLLMLRKSTPHFFYILLYIILYFNASFVTQQFSVNPLTHIFIFLSEVTVHGGRKRIAYLNILLL